MNHSIILQVDLSRHLDTLLEYGCNRRSSIGALEWFVRCLLCRGNAHEFTPQDVLLDYINNNFGESFIYTNECTRIFDGITRDFKYRLPHFDPYDEMAPVIKTHDIVASSIGYICVRIPANTYQLWMK